MRIFVGEFGSENLQGELSERDATVGRLTCTVLGQERAEPAGHLRQPEYCRVHVEEY